MNNIQRIPFTNLLYASLFFINYILTLLDSGSSKFLTLNSLFADAIWPKTAWLLQLIAFGQTFVIIGGYFHLMSSIIFIERKALNCLTYLCI